MLLLLKRSPSAQPCGAAGPGPHHLSLSLSWGNREGMGRPPPAAPPAGFPKCVEARPPGGAPPSPRPWRGGRAGGPPGTAWRPPVSIWTPFPLHLSHPRVGNGGCVRRPTRTRPAYPGRGEGGVHHGYHDQTSASKAAGPPGASAPNGTAWDSSAATGGQPPRPGPSRPGVLWQSWAPPPFCGSVVAYFHLFGLCVPAGAVRCRRGPGACGRFSPAVPQRCGAGAVRGPEPGPVHRTEARGTAVGAAGIRGARGEIR